jgi:hypothetical protein
MLDIALEINDSECPDVTLPFRDVINTLHQINNVLLREDCDEIDRDFFGTDLHLTISSHISLISIRLLDCHQEFKARGIASEKLVSYAWLLAKAWHFTLCQDVVNLWGLLVGSIKGIGDFDQNTAISLMQCVPIERRNSDSEMYKRPIPEVVQPISSNQKTPDSNKQ